MNSTFTSQVRFKASVTAANTAVQRQLVATDLDRFDATLSARLAGKRTANATTTAAAAAAAGGGGGGGSPAAVGGGTAARLITQTPYEDGSGGGGVSMVEAALRVQRAAEWLARCPAATLRQLQRRVLCRGEAAFIGYGGIPSALQPHAAQLPYAAALRAMVREEDDAMAINDNNGTIVDAATGNGGSSRSRAPRDMAVEAPPLEPLLFSDFLLQYVAVQPPGVSSSGSGSGGEPGSGGALLIDTRIAKRSAAVGARNRRSHTPESDGTPPPPPDGVEEATAEATATVSQVYLRMLLAPPAEPPSTSRCLIAVSPGAVAAHDLQGHEAIITFTTEVVVGPAAEAEARRWLVEQSAAEAGRPRTALLDGLARWAAFFTACFDESGSGACEDGGTVVAAILLACGIKGAEEEAETPDAAADEAVRRVRDRTVSSSSGGGQRCGHAAPTGATASDYCTACARRQAALEHRSAATAHYEASWRAASNSSSGGGAEPTRFFLGTAAVVLWAQAFLLHHRFAQDTMKEAGGRGGTATDDDNDDVSGRGGVFARSALSSAEAFLLRDWIVRAARREARCLARQSAGRARGSSTLRAARSCADGEPPQEVRFGPEEVDAAAVAMGAWVQRGIDGGEGLLAGDLWRLLRERLPVAAYYATFFC